MVYGAKTEFRFQHHIVLKRSPFQHHIVLKRNYVFGTIWCHMVPHGAKKCQNGAPNFSTVANLGSAAAACKNSLSKSGATFFMILKKDIQLGLRVNAQQAVDRLENRRCKISILQQSLSSAPSNSSDEKYMALLFFLIGLFSG